MDHNYQLDQSFATKRRRIETLKSSCKDFGDGDPNLMNKLTSWAFEESIGNSSFSNLLAIIKPHCVQKVRKDVDDDELSEQADVQDLLVSKRTPKYLLGTEEELSEITCKSQETFCCETEVLKCSQNGSSEIFKLAAAAPQVDHLTFEKLQRIESKLDLVLKEHAEIKKLLFGLNYQQPKQKFSIVNLPNDNVALPIKTPKEFLDMEKSLASDDFYQSFVEKLSLCGGFSTKDVVHRIMKALLLHDLSLNITWSGKVPGKLGFQGTLISKAVMDSVRRNSETSLASDAECEKEIKSWLRNASDRNGGRMKRRQVLNCPSFM